MIASKLLLYLHLTWNAVKEKGTIQPALQESYYAHAWKRSIHATGAVHLVRQEPYHSCDRSCSTHTTGVVLSPLQHSHPGTIMEPAAISALSAVRLPGTARLE